MISVAPSDLEGVKLKKGSEIQYPHHEGAGVILPDCSRGVYTPFRLTSREKRELIRDLAEKGLKGIDDFLERERESGAVKDRMDDLRRKMEEDLRNVREKRRRSLDDEIRKMTDHGALDSRETKDGLLDPTRYRRISSEEIRGEILANDLIRVLEQDHDIQRTDVRKKGLLEFLKRIWMSLVKFIRRVIMKIKRAFYNLFRRGEKDRTDDEISKQKDAISIPFPSIKRDLESWEDEMDRRLKEDRNLQKAVNQKISENTGEEIDRIDARRSLDPNWYKKEAKRILETEVTSIIDEKEKDLESRLQEEREARKQWEKKERERREKIMALEKELDSEIKERERTLEDSTREELKRELTSTLSNMGFLQRMRVKDDLEDATGEWEITQALVEKFSELIFSEVMEKRRQMKDLRGTHVSDAGVYEKAKLRTISEESRMDILQTIVNARMNHPGDRELDHHDMTVLREVATSEILCLIIMDISGSMEENMRMEAARRSVLALTQAIKRDNPRNRVDIIALSTNARPISLKEVMTIEPKGFTNHQEALAMARSIFESSRADRNMLFLITDGLPEAYTDENGKAVAGDLDMAMELALKESSNLLRFSNLTFNIFLLEPEDEDFVRSARRIAQEGDGVIITADPRQLADKMMDSYQGDRRILEGI
jgi:Mg-chelatase subunit ChlD